MAGIRVLLHRYKWLKHGAIVTVLVSAMDQGIPPFLSPCARRVGRHWSREELFQPWAAVMRCFVLKSGCSAWSSSLVNDPVGQGQGLAGEVVEVLEFAELVVAADVGVVGGQRHQEVDETDDDNEAGDGRQDEHDGGVLHVVLAEHLHLGRANHLHVNPLGAWKKGIMNSKLWAILVHSKNKNVNSLALKVLIHTLL